MTSELPPEPKEDFRYDNSNRTGAPNGLDAPPRPYSPPQSGGSSNKKFGCWIAGCFGSLLLGVLLIAAMGVGGYWWLSQQVEKYTDAEPAPMPAVEMEAEEIAELNREVQAFFNQAVPESEATNAEEATEGEALSKTQELVLTADQINALIQSDETLANRAYIEIKDDRILAKVTIPTDQVPGGAGRHFNADAEVDVSLENGVLVIQIVDAKVKGEPLPEEFADELAKQNLAKEFYKNVETSKLLQRFESVEVVDNSVRMRLKNPEEERSGASEKTPPLQSPQEKIPTGTDTSSTGELFEEPTDQSEFDELTQ